MRWAFVLIGALALGSMPGPARAWNVLPPGETAWRASGRQAIRGITVGPIESSQQPGRGYGTDYSARLLDELARMGVNWISITPFGRIWDLEDTRIAMDFEAPYDENRRAVRRMIRQAHARGMRVLVIPHLWVETGGWRGEIDPGSPEGWRAYQASYRDFVLAWARDAAAAGADAFSIGVECKSWSGRFGGFWTRFIADVREVFPGLLTYSANWDEAEDVLFWEQLDVIGINAFYPLADHDGATYEEYRKGADRVADRLEAMAEAYAMPVAFVEVGYTTREDAAVEPWIWPDHMEDVTVDEHEQARALAAVFEAVLDEPWFAGFFVWRYYANLDDVSQEAIWGFSPHGKEAEPLLDRVFDHRWAADPPRWPWERPQRPDPLDRQAYPFTGLLGFHPPDATP
ncbi:MAG: glycoside hydrolase family 113 [Myxococcota bacterium]